MERLYDYGLTDRFIGEATMYPELELARVIAQHRGRYKIITEMGEQQAEISGKLRYETTELAKFPAVGDFVMISHGEGDGVNIIHHVLRRKSLFLRSAVGVNDQAQPVASNIDYVFICMSLNNNFNLNRLERYLSVAWDSGAVPVVVLTKADLCDDVSQAENKVLQASSYSDVISISVYDNDVPQKLSKYLKSGTTSAFIGSSGVGKSTLINLLIGENLIATAQTGNADKGRHTTTGREMFLSPFGGVLIDTPGMRELGVEGADVEKTFDDIEQLAKNCKFQDCTHTKEPGCAINEAIENKLLDKRRYDNYRKIKIEVGYDGLSAKEIESKKLERMFKDVGGVKNIRKFRNECFKKQTY